MQLPWQRSQPPRKSCLVVFNPNCRFVELPRFMWWFSSYRENKPTAEIKPERSRVIFWLSHLQYSSNHLMSIIACLILVIQVFFRWNFCKVYRYFLFDAIVQLMHSNSTTNGSSYLCSSPVIYTAPIHQTKHLLLYLSLQNFARKHICLIPNLENRVSLA